MKEDSRNYAWVAILVLGALFLVGGFFLLSVGRRSSTTTGLGGLAPVTPPVASPEEEADAALVEPSSSFDTPTLRVRAEGGVESAEGLAADPQTSELRLTVVHADGTPAHGALCVLSDETGLHDLEETDAAGRCSLRGLEGTAELIVLGATLPTFRKQITDCRGELSITLPEGSFVSGVLLVDGAPPTQRTFISLDHWVEGLEHLDSDLRWEARFAEREGEVSQPVGVDGSFRFSVQPADWSGELELSRELLLVESSDSLELGSPREGVVLRATRRPVIRGRVLLPGGVNPAPFAVLRMELSKENAAFTWTDAADAQGRFEIGIIGGLAQEHRDPYDHVEIDIYDVDRVGYRKLDQTLEPFLGRDVGDIILDASRDVPLLVIDASTEEPVEGALAYSGENRSDPTASDGRTVLRGLRPGLFEIQVLSIAHANTKVPVPLSVGGEELQEITVRLERATTLEVLVSLPDGTPVPDIALRLEGSCAIFGEEEPTHPAEIHTEMGASDSGNSSVHRYADGRTEVETNFVTDAAGRCLLVGIDPECTFSLSVNDDLHHPLYREVDIQLERGEHRLIEIACPQEPRVLRGTLRDELGGPIAGARIFARSAEIEREGGGGPLQRRPRSEPDYSEDVGRVSTDESGSWAFEGLFAPRMDLLATAEGFETLVMSDIEVAPGGGLALELVMRKPLPLKIRVRAGNESLTDRFVGLNAYVDGWRLRGLDYDSGLWTLSGPPDFETVFQAQCAEREFHRIVLPTGIEVDWDLPPLGTVRLSWDFGEPHSGARILQLRSVGRPDETIGRWLGKGLDASRGSRGFRAFPGPYEAVMLGTYTEDGDFEPITQMVPLQVEAGEGAEAVEVELQRK